MFVWAPLCGQPNSFARRSDKAHGNSPPYLSSTLTAPPPLPHTCRPQRKAVVSRMRSTAVRTPKVVLDSAGWSETIAA